MKRFNFRRVLQRVHVIIYQKAFVIQTSLLVLMESYKYSRCLYCIWPKIVQNLYKKILNWVLQYEQIELNCDVISSTSAFSSCFS